MLQQYKHILVAIDGSYEAELAFQKAVEVAKRNEAELFLVHVIDTRAFQNVSSFDSAMVEQVTETAKKTMEQYVAMAKENGLDKVNFSIEYGAPKVVVAKEIPKAQDIDLIMIGATGLNAVERLLIGSVTEYVTRTAVCDVLVVRTDLNNKPALNQAGKKADIQPK
ncbi:universal stress protein [Loigolactobacillus bifermentans]|jgi:nucleotide-binding universal stress UspA family protein|uniref:Universal stress protein n=1 Tax=Loigolactobacillus bifermentans DSM 20003 TaxID=1423726 RepID=A0A0R1H1X9_9LACO|nr:universal stress protein [Loigolactobacillus bifermentans]KRK40431.1 universal stress protein UspA family protein [Loigolactobacillus bifermentans DSM 20003]QGG59845.1 universal stress protein [Loigolactobacillus bifermentans]